ncbi:hypothetical protein HOD83_03105 [Candidatus Woesearchaeota archaeon]|jgi:hypothetical protein|nr:hypothetical protein [Candidatus Woesearchaeota archaeon]MBT4114258.1 hypothetical protein [Candidatus Woesearchaeota archaeon]MBT4248546.1 hypothetical protein [Candidatus Woesearchaeota archaeon]
MANPFVLRPLKRLKLELDLLTMKLNEKQKLKRKKDIETLQDEVENQEERIKLLQLKLKKKQLKKKQKKIKRKLRS